MVALIKEGGYYRDRNGNTHGPLAAVDDPVYRFKFGALTWEERGFFLACSGQPHDYDLVEEASDVGSIEEAIASSAGPDESRALTVSVWFGFAPVVADVVVSNGLHGTVSINCARVEPKGSVAFALSDRELDKLAVIRANNHVSLRDAIVARAKEEAFA